MLQYSQGLIYTLSDPDTELVRYVGQTINLPKRVNLHLFHSKNGQARTHKEKWINGLLKAGKSPLVNIVLECDVQLLDQKESEFIALYKSFGANLTNATLGGKTTRGRKCSEETKEKLRQMFTGKCRRPPITEEEKRAASLRRQNWKPSPESVAKMRETKKGVPTGRKLTDQEKAKFHARSLSLSKSIVVSKEGSHVTYPSIKEAARCTGVDTTSIRRYLNGKRKSCKAYTFQLA